MSDLLNYAKAILREAHDIGTSCEVFAKILTRNDDSGRHGVLIPADAYSFFPPFTIPDPTRNATLEFPAFNTVTANHEVLAYKYYERYPERRITRLPGVLNDLTASGRILILLRAKQPNGTFHYYLDCANSSSGSRFEELFHLIFGSEVAPNAGSFVIRPVDSKAFSADAVLTELLEGFDGIRARGWIDTLRAGDTGIGYTFETLLGIEENNDQQADFKGIEIKCKGTKEGQRSTSAKLNLFQAGPTWLVDVTSKELIRILGKPGDDGLFGCYSQVTVTPNNLGLLLEVLQAHEKIDLRKSTDTLGYWTFSHLAKRLAEKHSRAAFVKARVRTSEGKAQFCYDELVYCDSPSIDRFVSLVDESNIVFEFTMSEKTGGKIRNHGYPWRLVRGEFLDRLFAFQIKLR